MPKEKTRRKPLPATYEPGTFRRIFADLTPSYAGVAQINGHLLG